MPISFRTATIGSLCACAVILPGHLAQAANITGTTGTWTSGTLDGGGAPAGVGTNQISWGNPAPPNDIQSSYVFNGRGAFNAPEDGTPFSLGTFIHNNFPIFAPVLDSATLAVNLAGEINQAFTFDVNHFETPNSGSPCAAGGSQPCPDLVSFPSLFSSETVILNGQEFLLEIVGFQQGSTTTPSFLTLENQSNEAELIGRLTPPTAVPTPALLPGLIGMGLATLRKRRSNAETATA